MSESVTGIQPSVLKWARERAGFTELALAGDMESGQANETGNE